ncbi:MAG TPA: replicative DNA helicase [Candidatus Acidoferrales bacterium]|nr:replicative DNA helicase [Candidatus Acidoferrales bacterium]
MPDIEKPLPHYLEAERSVLGAILVNNPALMTTIEKGLKAEDFFLPQHKLVFEAMLSLDEARQPVDAVTLTELLHREGKLDAAGGPEYIAQLMDGVHRAINVEHYARIVREKAVLRNLIHATEAIQEQAFEARDSVDEILDRAESFVFKLAEERIRAGFVGVKELILDNTPRLERIFNEGKRVTGLATNYSQLDNLTSGLQPSELIIIAARPSMGKTAFALNIAENVSVLRKEPVAIFSLEMSKESLLLRLVASHSRVDAHKFRTGHLGHEDWSKIVAALARLGEAPLWIDDSAASTVLEMSAKARRLKKEKGLSLVIVDYMQLIAAHGRFGNRNEEVSYISRSLKAMAKELKVPVIVLSQLTRAPEKEEREPLLADLRESGAIEQDADVVLFIHRPGFYKTKDELPEEERNKARLIIAKQRNGPTDKLNFVFLGNFTRFEEAAPNSFGTFPE